MAIDPTTASTALAPAPRPGTAPPPNPPALSTTTTPTQPDSVHKSTAIDPTKFYTADSIRAAIDSAAHTASAIAAGASGAMERAGPTFEELGVKAADVAGGVARAAAPIVGTAVGAAALVIGTQSPAGETLDQLAHARATDAQGRQGSTTATPAAPRHIEHTGNGAPPAATIGSTSTPIEQVGNSTTTTPAHSLDRAWAVSGKPVGPAVTAADHATLKIDAHDVQQKYLPGWSVGQTSVTKTDPTAGRAAFEAKDGPKRTYIKDLATKHADQLKAAGVPDKQIEAMKDGVVPKGYDVHHIMGLSQGGTNDADNLVLVRRDPVHLKITGQQNSAMAGMKYGDTRSVDALYPPKGTVIYKGTP